ARSPNAASTTMRRPLPRWLLLSVIGTSCSPQLIWRHLYPSSFSGYCRRTRLSVGVSTGTVGQRSLSSAAPFGAYTYRWASPPVRALLVVTAHAAHSTAARSFWVMIRPVHHHHVRRR